jgi:death on curing protein
VTAFRWPHRQALLDDFAEYFEEIGQELRVRAPDALEAGFERARLAEGYQPEADAATLAALIFEAIVTRHPLIDGNKRLAWQAMTTFLDLNGIWFDPPEIDSFKIAMAVVIHERTTDDLAAFIRRHTSVLDDG